VLITGPDNAEMMAEKIQLARSFTKKNEQFLMDLLLRVAQIAASGEIKEYKYGEY